MPPKSWPKPPRGIATLLFAVAIASAAFGAAAQEGGLPWNAGCKTGNQVLLYYPHPLLDAQTVPGFADSLFIQLITPLEELGYCLEMIRNHGTILDTARYGDNLVLQTQVEDGRDEAGSGTLLVALLRVRELAGGKLAEALSRPLVSLNFGMGELQGLSSILVKKISENMRRQYVADLFIRSNPPGAMVRAATGLQGRTPVEWVMPLGILPVTLEKSGYLPLHRKMDLSAPGQHSYDLQLVKRRFYHSKFIYPTLAAGAVAVAALALENHYYAEYRNLDEGDLNNRPEAFAQNFRAAKTYERIAYTSFGLAWLSLVLSFTF